MSVIAMVQARMGSTRLPGKVLESLMDRTLLEMVLRQLSFAKELDEVIVLTTFEKRDLPVIALCARLGVRIFSGSVNDVLDRYYQAARLLEPNHVVRITADCPLIDPEIVDALVRLHKHKGNDYTSNTMEETFPDGLDAEVLTYKCLAAAWRDAAKPSEREHVTLFIKNNPERFQLGSMTNDRNLGYLRWTIDEPVDLELIRKIYSALYKENAPILSKAVVAWLEDHPELADLNSFIERNEGLKLSLAKENA